MKTILVNDGDRLTRAPDPAESSSPRRGCAILGLIVLAISALVGHFYFGFGPLAAVLLAPFLVALAGVASLSLVWLIAAPPFYLRRRRRNRNASSVLDSVLAGSKTTRVILFLRQFNPDRGWTFKIAMTLNDDRTGLELLDDEFQRFDLEGWANDMASIDMTVLKVADRIDAAGGSVRLDGKTWKETVGELIKRADRIAILPGLGQGVLWEVEQAKALERVDATTFIMPYGSTRNEVEGNVWEKYRAAYAALGFDFPRYDRDGMLMRFDRNGSLIRTLPIVGSKNEELRAFIGS